MTLAGHSWPRGLMDKASHFGWEDSRFESWWGRYKYKVQFVEMKISFEKLQGVGKCVFFQIKTHFQYISVW